MNRADGHDVCIWRPQAHVAGACWRPRGSLLRSRPWSESAGRAESQMEALLPLLHTRLTIGWQAAGELVVLVLVVVAHSRFNC